MDYTLSVGSIIVDHKNYKNYRVVAVSESFTTLCEMNTTKFTLLRMEVAMLLGLIHDGNLSIERDDEIVFNEGNLIDELRTKYLIRKSMMHEVLNTYGPDYMELCSKKTKPELEAILLKYNISKNTFWRLCNAYFQSGLRNSALVDLRHFGNTKGKTYNYETKTGRPTEYLSNTGIVITNEVQGYFEEALKDYKSGRYVSIKDAFDRMNLLHFTKTELSDGELKTTLLPASERPTITQFRYFVNKHLNNQEKDLIKTSAMEQRNNKRLLLSDSLYGVKGPGDLVEIDACEADISLVSVLDPTKTVGRPIVYFMIDVYSRIILAASVAFDNNSMLGLSNLFLNLADDKQEYCARYGIRYDNPMIWPSNIIPNRVRVDRGAEFKSKEFERICNELGIERTLVLPGSGSLKGVVEQSFRQLHNNQNVHLENHGLIQKRHGSNHHQTATLNIEEYTQMVIGFVLAHNQKCLETYHMDKNMIEQGIKPIPALLWQYGIKNCYTPRSIPAKEQYLFNLMTPINARITRKGILYKELWYSNNNDNFLRLEMFNAGSKFLPFDARMDMRDVGSIYYIRDNRLMRADLNAAIRGNADYIGFTMKQYEDYLRKKKELLAEGKTHNEELSAFTYALNNNIVEAADKQALPDAKNMRPVREIEKQAKSKSNNIAQRLDLPPAQPTLASITPPVEKETKEIDTYSSWEEALEDW